ncbi:hypothetical protein CRUP_031147 [Coryphaenoides rupestris]|nr:hypothetical protein CRUP_031147 [Coryphaenoides rupestris]
MPPPGLNSVISAHVPDFCSSLKITDQSNRKISCNIFCDRLEDHPKIFQLGDIIRMHRVKSKAFGGSINLLNTFGYSVVTFDGRPGTTVVPRTSSNSFHFEPQDEQTVTTLRAWAVTQDLVPTAPSVRLSSVQPQSYFDLTCQLLWKAPVDTTCILLKVWDGTRCAHPLQDFSVDASLIEGPSSLSGGRSDLAVKILVFDNHAEIARKIKPGAYLRIYNLHATTGTSSAPVSSSGSGQNQLAFHLHGGTSYGRGIRVLPDDSPDTQALRRVVESFPEDDNNSFDLGDSAIMETWGTPPESLPTPPPESLDDARGPYATERRCGHALERVTLAKVKQSGPDQLLHVRAQLKQEIPDDDFLAAAFLEASKDPGHIADFWLCTSPEPIVLPGDGPLSPGRKLSIHLSEELLYVGMGKELIYVEGATLEDVCQLAAAYQYVLPVMSSGGSASLMDLSLPFLFRGTKRYYGCKQCSRVSVKELRIEGPQPINEEMIAEAICLFSHNQETFFQVSLEDVAANQEAQNKISGIMDFLCPPGGSVAEHPWLELCLTSYTVQEDDRLKRVCYQVCQTTTTTTPP